MNISVLSVDVHTGLLQVEVFGVVLPAHWCGSGAPTPGNYHAEIDFDPVDWSDIRAIPATDVGRSARGASVVRAEVIDAGHDGVAQLRARTGEELLVDTIGEPPLGAIGLTIEFTPQGVEVFPYDL